ncbi:hypothetical protein ACLOJK_023747 [Asimina triloba]
MESTPSTASGFKSEVVFAIKSSPHCLSQVARFTMESTPSTATRSTMELTPSTESVFKYGVDSKRGIFGDSAPTWESSESPATRLFLLGHYCTIFIVPLPLLGHYYTTSVAISFSASF